MPARPHLVFAKSGIPGGLVPDWYRNGIDMLGTEAPSRLVCGTPRSEPESSPCSSKRRIWVRPILGGMPSAPAGAGVGSYRGDTSRGCGFDGQRLRERRIAAGLSVSELARQAGVRPADVSRYEGGTMSPGPDRLAALAGCVGVSPLDLVVADRLGHGLKALRAAAGLTQAALAGAAGPDMTVSRVKSLELGKVRRLTHADTAELARALGVSPQTVREAHQWDLDHAAG